MIQAGHWEGGQQRMSKPYSEDLRERVVAAVEGGLSRRQAAEVFDVGVSSVIRWVQRFRATGSVAAKPMGGDHRSPLTGDGPGFWSASKKHLIGRLKSFATNSRPAA